MIKLYFGSWPPSSQPAGCYCLTAWILKSGLLLPLIDIVRSSGPKKQRLGEVCPLQPSSVQICVLYHLSSPSLLAQTSQISCYQMTESFKILHLNVGSHSKLRTVWQHGARSDFMEEPVNITHDSLVIAFGNHCSETGFTITTRGCL